MKKKQDKFLSVFEPLKNSLWRFCLNLARSREEAKDLLQDVIEAAYRQFDDVRSEKAFLSYLFTIAERKYYYEKEKRSKFYSEDSDFSHIIDYSQSPEKRLELKLIYEALDKLPPEQKNAVILCESLGYSNQEAAEIEQISLDALKQRLYRGKKALRAIFNLTIIDKKSE